MLSATISINGKSRRIEERDDGLWYLSDPQDQAELGTQGKPYIHWYEMSDFILYECNAKFRPSGRLPKTGSPYS